MPPRSRKNSSAHELSLGRDDDSPRREGGDLFLWTIAILLLIGVALGCWIFSFYVFGHPEKAFSYKILSKLKKLDPPKRFELTAAPRGEFLSAKQLWERYARMTPRELERANEGLFRDYLRNYKLTKDIVPYVVGSFNILDSYELNNKYVFPSGVVAIAQSKEAPQVLLEQVFTADQKVVETLQRMLLTGLDFRLDRNIDLSALIHVEKLSDGRFLFTAIPILYSSYASSSGPGSFSLDPPTSIDPGPGLPLLKAAAIADAQSKYADYQRRAGLGNTKLFGNTVPPQKTLPQLVRVERPPDPTPTPKPASVVMSTPTPKPAPAALPVATPVPAVADMPPASPTPASTPAVAASDVPLKPFNSPTPASIATTAGGNWPTYAPGQMPRGRLVNMSDMKDLAGQTGNGERMYLRGNFVVKASNESRAVLRSQSAVGETFGFGGKTSNVRIIVDFPNGEHPPSEGSTFSRDSRRPFLITEIRKGDDGVVNVWVREVTRP